MTNFYNKKISELKLNKIDNPELNLRIIINNSLYKKKQFFLNKIGIKDINLKKFNFLFNRRIKGEPLSKIFNKKEFWSLDFYTNDKVLDPRPETEFIIQSVFKYYKNKNIKMSVCDLGTGSGCIIITILKFYKKFSGFGIDISNDAIQVARKNSKKHLVEGRLTLINNDWNCAKEKFDIIVSNPPYIKNNDLNKLSNEVKLYDPKISLLGGVDGYKKYKELAPIVSRCMKKDSIFFLEIGKNQKIIVLQIFKKYNLKVIEVVLDLQGIERVLIFKKLYKS